MGVIRHRLVFCTADAAQLGQPRASAQPMLQFVRSHASLLLKSEDILAPKTTWKKGRGKLGFLRPLLGTWTAQADSPMGPLYCHRTFAEILGGTVIRLEARWEFGASHPPSTGHPRSAYEELALISAGEDKAVHFWSFTSDGKRSTGTVSDVSALHPEAIGFEAQMPAGVARMVYWPEGADGFVWVVEARHAKGWRRFTEHHYRRA